MLESYDNCYYDTCKLATKYGGQKFKIVGSVTGRITSKQNLEHERSKEMSEKYTKQFYVAGVKFRKDWKETIKELNEGEILQLVPEPTNRFDPNAIRIATTIQNEPGPPIGTMLGYVPAKTGEANEVTALLNAGKVLDVTLIELQPDFEPWKALLVEVKEI